MFPTLLIALTMLTQTAVIPLQNPIHTLGEATFSLSDRYAVASVSDVFADNILLTMSYLRGTIKNNQPDWTEVRKPFTYTFSLKPGEVFAFHEDVLPEFAGKVVKTTNAHFGSQEGFKSDGYLVADGVCHLASLINEAAERAGLKVVAPTNHDFAVIPEVDKKYGTAIYFMPGEKGANAQQNLYVENNTDKPVTFVFIYKNNSLDVRVDTEN